MRRLVAIAMLVGLGVLAYLAAVAISFRMLGNREVGLTPAHRRLLDA